MDESAVAFCAKDGVALVLKMLKDKEKVPAFKLTGNDPLMTKKIDSKLTIDKSIKWEINQIGDSLVFVVFATKDERLQVSSMISKAAKSFTQHFNCIIPVKSLCEEIANNMNQMSVRGFNNKAEVIFASWNLFHGAELYAINSDKNSFKYSCYAIGDGSEFIKSRLSCIQTQNLTTVECMVEGLKMLMDESDEDFDFQLIRICAASQGKYEMLCDEMCKEVLMKAMQK